MSFDGLTERDNVMTRAATLCAGRVFEGVPDDAVIERDTTTNLVKPYLVVRFGTMIGSPDDRAMAVDEDGQPQVWPITIECWAANDSVANDTAAGVRGIFLGWSPNAGNATTFQFGNGGGFQSRNQDGRPTRSMVSVPMTTTLNMSTP